MAYGRKTTTRTIRRRRVVRRRRVNPLAVTKRASRPIRLRAAGERVFSFTRFSDQIYKQLDFTGAGPASAYNATISTLAAAAGVEVNSSYITFRFEDMPNDSEFTALFRWFRLTGVKITFSMRGLNANVNGTSTGGLPIMSYAWAPDMSITTMPSTLQQARERANFKKCYFSPTRRSLSVFYRPILHSLSQDAAGNPYTTRGGRPWLSCAADKAAQHQGLWVNIDNTTSSSAVTLDIEAKYYFKMKGVQ